MKGLKWLLNGNRKLQWAFQPVTKRVSHLHSQSKDRSEHYLSLRFINSEKHRFWNLLVRNSSGDENDHTDPEDQRILVSSEWGKLGGGKVRSASKFQLVNIKQFKSRIREKEQVGYEIENTYDLKDLLSSFQRGVRKNSPNETGSTPAINPNQAKNTPNLHLAKSNQVNAAVSTDSAFSERKKITSKESKKANKQEEFILKLRKKRGGNLSDLFWEVSVRENISSRRWGIVTEEDILGKTQNSTRIYDSGKQNRTAKEQAIFEAVSDAKKKLRGDYSLVEVSGLGDELLLNTLHSSSKAKESLPPLPMLATVIKENYIMQTETGIEEVLVQPKLDGLRCIVDLKTGELWSRTRILYKLDYLQELIRGKDTDELRWLDGELYRHGTGIQEINSLVRTENKQIPENTKNGQAVETEQVQIGLHIFDAVLDSPIENRLQVVGRWFNQHFGKSAKQEVGDIISVVDTVKRKTGSALLKEHKRLTSLGYEGIMIRILNDSGYLAGKRSSSLQKFKTILREEFECVDILERRSTADREPITGAAVLKTKSGKLFNAAPKCSFKERREMLLNREEYLNGNWIGIVEFFEYTPGEIPRHPRLVGFRHVSDL